MNLNRKVQVDLKDVLLMGLINVSYLFNVLALTVLILHQGDYLTAGFLGFGILWYSHRLMNMASYIRDQLKLK